MRLCRRLCKRVCLLQQSHHLLPKTHLRFKLGRIGIHIEVPSTDYEKLSDERFGEPSATIQVRLVAARQRPAIIEKWQRSCQVPHLSALLENEDTRPDGGK